MVSPLAFVRLCQIVVVDCYNGPSPPAWIVTMSSPGTQQAGLLSITAGPPELRSCLPCYWHGRPCWAPMSAARCSAPATESATRRAGPRPDPAGLDPGPDRGHGLGLGQPPGRFCRRRCFFCRWARLAPAAGPAPGHGNNCPVRTTPRKHRLVVSGGEHPSLSADGCEEEAAVSVRRHMYRCV